MSPSNLLSLCKQKPRPHVLRWALWAMQIKRPTFPVLLADGEVFAGIEKVHAANAIGVTTLRASKLTPKRVADLRKYQLSTSSVSNGQRKHANEATAIVQWRMGWVSLPQYPRLAPTAMMLKKWKSNPDPEAFNRELLVQLENLNPIMVLDDLPGGAHKVLCCYEKKKEDCHRLQVARWFEYHLGFAVPELGEATVDQEPSKQQNLAAFA